MNKGQSLFEVVLALGIVSLIIIGIVILAANSIKNSSYSRDKTQATRYAQEATEWLRGERDTDWTLFAQKAATPLWCLPALSWGSAQQRACQSTEAISGTFFTRELYFSVTDADTIATEVNIAWSDGQGLHEVRSSTIFTNWRAK
jgi:Tfp pilus assembly protein PilV